MKSAKQILIDARELIKDEANWCQHVRYTRNHRGTVVKRCVLEAIWAAGKGQIVPAKAFDVLRKVNGGLAILDWNDTSTHAKVIAGLNEAIRLPQEAS